MLCRVCLLQQKVRQECLRLQRIFQDFIREWDKMIQKKVKKYQILVNADDFGRHELINAAVARCVEAGCLRSATLMPGGAAFDDAVDVARAHPSLGVGIHLTLVNGFPVCNPAEIPSLVTKDGVFLDNYVAFVKHFLAGKVSMVEVRRELLAQAEKMKRTGLALTHVDSHQHMHMLPGVIDCALDAAEAAGVRRMRISHSPLFMAFEGVGQLVGRLGLFTLAEMSEWKAKRRNFVMPDYFAGIVDGEAVHEGHLLDIIRNMKPGTTEVMMHPGTDNRRLINDCTWNHDFEAELQAILSPKVLEALREKNVDVVNFGNL